MTISLELMAVNMGLVVFSIGPMVASIDKEIVNIGIIALVAINIDLAAARWLCASTVHTHCPPHPITLTAWKM